MRRWQAFDTAVHALALICVPRGPDVGLWELTRAPIDLLATLPKVARLCLRLDADAIVDRRRDSLGAAKVAFCGLDGDVTKQELNLLQLAAGAAAQAGATSSPMPRSA